jgi:hypothetical protein
VEAIQNVAPITSLLRNFDNRFAFTRSILTRIFMRKTIDIAANLLRACPVIKTNKSENAWYGAMIHF